MIIISIINIIRTIIKNNDDDDFYDKDIHRNYNNFDNVNYTLLNIYDKNDNDNDMKMR